MDTRVNVGQAIEFDYPAANYHGVKQRLERRRLRVERIRDLAAEPLDPLTPILDPNLRRGRLLAIGTDLDRGAERSFYLDSMQEVKPIDGPKFKERFFQIVGIAEDGRERVLMAATTESGAAGFVNGWNKTADLMHETAEAREITEQLPSLARDLGG